MCKLLLLPAICAAQIISNILTTKIAVARGCRMRRIAARPVWRSLWRPIYAREQAYSEADERRANEAAQRRFEYEHQHALGVTTLPPGAPKQARRLAAAKPWTGEESPYDTARRMVLDKYDVSRGARAARLVRARNDAQDYHDNEVHGQTVHERVRPHLRASSGVTGVVESIAAQQIEDAMARGLFDDLPRGGPLPTDYHGARHNPHVDLTESILNTIIRNQGGAPPWIERQKAVAEQTDFFRQRASAQLCDRLVHRCTEHAAGDEKAKQAAQRIAALQNLRDLEWERQTHAYFEQAVARINSAIRSYNIQAPAAARKSYIAVKSERALAYARARRMLPEALRRHLGTVPLARVAAAVTEFPLEPAGRHYGLRDLLRDLFRGKAPR